MTGKRKTDIFYTINNVFFEQAFNEFTTPIEFCVIFYKLLLGHNNLWQGVCMILNLKAKNGCKLIQAILLVVILAVQISYARQAKYKYYYDMSFKAKSTDAKIANLKKSISLNPNFSKSRSRLCAYYSLKKQNKQAEIQCGKALDIDPSNAFYYWQLSLIYHNQQRYADAIATANEGLNIDSVSHRLYSSIADSYMALGRYNQAIEDYTNAITFEKKNPSYYTKRALAYIYAGGDQAYKQAFYDYDNAINIAPNFAEGYQGRGETNLALGRISDGINDLKKAVKLNPKLPHAYKVLGYYYFVNKKYTQARDNFIQMLRYDRNNPETHLYMGIYYIETKDIGKALISLENAFKLGFTMVKQLEDPKDGFGKHFLRIKNNEQYKKIINKWEDKIKSKGQVTSVEVYK